MAGTGKRTRLHEALKALATSRGLPFTTQLRTLGGTTPTSGDDGGDDDAAGPEAEAGQFLHEASLVHIGLDIARMSMKDKHILRPILTNLGQGSQVLAGDKGRGARILVLYHAHLLSSESVLLLQACLEQNEGDLSIWMTSELPVPQRIRDWFVEIPVAGVDNSFEAYRAALPEAARASAADWPQVFRGILDRWRAAPPPTLSAVKEVKAYVYEMLMRNLRWVEATHFLLDAILGHEGLTEEQRGAALSALAACEATAGGYTIPSYRIPILWESLFLQLRSLLARKESPAEIDGASAPAARPGRVTKPRKKASSTAGTKVAVV
jgi:hypothetical protein